MFYGSAQVFYVKDLITSVDFYCDVLGFKCPKLWGNPPSFAMPQRDNVIVMLSQQADLSLIRPKINIWEHYFWVRDATALFNELKEKGAVITQELTVKEEYGNLEFIIQDPDGYTLAFGQDYEIK